MPSPDELKHITWQHEQYLLSQAQDRLKQAQDLDEAYASADAMPAEQFNRDLLALVQAARQVAEDFDLVHLRRAVDQFEPWLEQDEDPRSMGWVDDKGRP